MSHDLFDDLLADVPHHVTVDPERAWRSGTARRRVRYAVEAAVVTVVVAVLGLGAVALHDRTPVQPAGSDGVQGYPAEVPRPLFQRDLPDTPGPLVGGFSWQGQPADGESHWAFVTPSGTTWSYDGNTDWFQPALSEDGRMLAELEDGGSDDATFVLRDLVTGDRTEFPDVGDARTVSGDTYMVAAQSPGFFSPDDRTLVTSGFLTKGTTGGVLLLGTDGRVVQVEGLGFPVGWRDDHTYVVLRGRALVTFDTRGTELSRVRLNTGPGWQLPNQWSGRLSPDGSQVAVVINDDLARYRVLIFDAINGRRLDKTDWYSDGASTLPVWHDERPLVWRNGGLVDPRTGAVVLATDPRWGGASFAQWTAGALAGPEQPGPGLLDVGYWSLWWSWPWILGGVGGLLLAAAVVWRTRRDARLEREAVRSAEDRPPAP